MRRVLFLVFAAPLAISTFSSAQTGSMADLRADEQRLQRQQMQLDLDRDHLVSDRRAHVPRTQIRFDQLQIKRDRLEIRQLKADIRRDRRARRRYGSTF
jgi:parvulin-like peptidyl-prolyl isomerase